MCDTRHVPLSCILGANYNGFGTFPDTRGRRLLVIAKNNGMNLFSTSPQTFLRATARTSDHNGSKAVAWYMCQESEVILTSRMKSIGKQQDHASIHSKARNGETEMYVKQVFSANTGRCMKCSTLTFEATIWRFILFYFDSVTRNDSVRVRETNLERMRSGEQKDGRRGRLADLSFQFCRSVFFLLFFLFFSCWSSGALHNTRDVFLPMRVGTNYGSDSEGDGFNHHCPENLNVI